MEFLLATYLLLSLIFVVAQLCKLVFRWRDQCCYMLAYECYKATQDRKLSTDLSAKIVLRNDKLGLDEYKFLLKTIVNSGIGEDTYGPRNVLEGREDFPTLDDALSEVDEIIYDTLDSLFARTGISPSQIDILVVNVSLFTPVPSLSSRIINKYKMREDIKAFNLSGMGCSASVVAIDLVQHLFKSHKKALAIVVSTECMGPNWYCGKERSMMLSNLLFRSGGCSMLFTNDRALKDRAILKLKSMVRTHTGANSEAYECCIQVEDDLGYRGFSLSKGLTKAAGQAFSKNLRVLVPKVLPLWELLRYIILTHSKSSSSNKGNHTALNLKTGIDHFCIHPGGKAVIEGLGRSLGLSEYDLEPARMALYRFGNTSAGGLWYVLGYMEAKKRLKKGDIILMISLGAGFKCNNCVWEVMRDLKEGNVWKDCIESYPPKTQGINPYIEKYGWINDENLTLSDLEEKKAIFLQPSP